MRKPKVMPCPPVEIEGGDWKPPDWMKPFLPQLNNTGGNTVEELMNGKTNPAVNLPLAMLEMAAIAQIQLLTHLHKRGLLIEQVQESMK